MAEEFAVMEKSRGHGSKRPRLHSGCIRHSDSGYSNEKTNESIENDSDMWILKRDS